MPFVHARHSFTVNLPLTRSEAGIIPSTALIVDPESLFHPEMRTAEMAAQDRSSAASHHWDQGMRLILEDEMLVRHVSFPTSDSLVLKSGTAQMILVFG